MKKLLVIGSILVTLLFQGIAMGDTFVSWYGDDDGFGIGLALGNNLNVFALPNAVVDPGTITDRYLQNDQSWSLIYDVSGLGPITDIKLEMVTASLGAYGQADLYVDNVFIGKLTDSDDGIGGGLRPSVYNSFNLLGIASIDGNNTLKIDAMAVPGWEDVWAIDYAKLTINTVPEPTTLLLLGFGLIGLAGARRKLKK